MTWILAVVGDTTGPLGGRLDWLANGTRDAVINFGVALLVLIVGWLVARGISELIKLMLRAVRFNQMSYRMLGWGALEGGMEPATAASWVAFWGVMVLVILVALDAVGIHVRTAVQQRLVEVLPRVVVASFVALVGVLAASVVGTLLRAALRGAGWAHPGPPAQATSIAILVFAALLALEQLGLAAQLVVGVGLIITAAVALAVGLAFGLGCRDLARDLIVEYLRSIDERPGPRRVRTGTDEE